MLLEPWLVGPWEDLQLDSTTWGLILHDDTEVNLLDLTVCKHGRPFFTNISCKKAPVPFIFCEVILRNVLLGPGCGAFYSPPPWTLIPSLTLTCKASLVWNPDGLPQQQREPLLFPPPLKTSHITLGWTNNVSAPPCPGPAERTAQRQDKPQVSLPLKAGFSKVRVLLADKTLHRRYTITCRSLLHGTLSCMQRIPCPCSRPIPTGQPRGPPLHSLLQP